MSAESCVTQPAGTRWAGAFRSALASPSIERGTHFARELRTVVEEALPRDLRGSITVGIQAGVVQSVAVHSTGDVLDVGTAPGFRRELRAWVQARVPSDWFGSVAIHVRGGYVSHTAITRSFK